LHKTQGHYEAAQDYTFSALKMKNEMGDKWGIAMCLNNLGNIATNLGFYTEAREYCQESLTIREALDNKQGIASCFYNLGTIDLLEDNFDSTVSFYRQSLALQRQLNDVSGIIKVLTNLSLAAALQGKTGAAKRYLSEIKELNPASQNHLLLASIFVTMVILFSDEPGKEADCAFLIKVIEILLNQSGGVLEEAFLQPYLEVTRKFEVGRKPGQPKDEANPAQETNELIQTALTVTL
jgi:tetratricopeptide (TPR) repeat protein